MKDGIYESIINEELSRNLDSNKYYIKTEKLKGKDSKNIIVNYLSEVTQRALNTINEVDVDKDDDEIIIEEIRICNELIELLRSKLPFDEYRELNISENAEILEYAYNKVNNPLFDGKIIKPVTSLTEPTLFTNSSKEITLVSEIIKEIKSCDEVWLLVSFIKMSGINPIYNTLKEFTESGHKLRIITTTYMKATDFNAVKKLLELPNTEIKISYDEKTTRLHAKAYIFKRNNGYSTFYIGSSNLSSAALMSGNEWNVKLTEKKSPDIYKNVLSQFETYWNSIEYKEIHDIEEDLNYLRESLQIKKENVYLDLVDIKPYEYQEEILEKLDVERNIYHRNRNLIVAATGVGKTVLAAFDFKKFLEKNKDAKFLYVVHREEILKSALNKFRQILKDSNFGELYVGNNKPYIINRLFTTVYGANKLSERLEADYYDYIVVDEIHHAAAKTYDQLLEYFKPKELLGLTATPERMDGEDITKYFNYNITAEMRLPEAINKKLLCPFQYYGLSDTADYSNVGYNSFGYDISGLTKIYVDDEEEANKRVRMIINNLFKYINTLDEVHGLGFCASIKHAEYMANKFNEANIPSLAVSSLSDNEERKNAIKRLESGDLKFLFTVDLYNEGVDIPCINTELLLRPTDSLTIFLQQIGRGLRLYKDKACLTILDFIGEFNKKFNHENKLQALIGNKQISVAESIINNFPVAPIGCSIVLEKVAEDYILKNIKQNKSNKAKLIEMIATFSETTGKELSLKNLLEHYKMDITDLYINKDITFYRLLSEAGIDNFIETEYDNKYISRLNSLFKLNSYKLLNSIINYLNGLDLGDKNLKNMFYYSIFTNKPISLGFNSVDEALSLIKESKCLSFEIKEICNYLINNIDITTIDNDLLFESSLEVYGIYNQSQILAGLGYFDENNFHPLLEGVLYYKEHNHDVFFITLNKNNNHFGESISYEDYPINDELFHWQTQNRVSEGSATLDRYTNSNGRVSLFVRVDRNYKQYTSPYFYLGEAQYVSHEGSKPASIVWKLNNKIPAHYLKQMKNID